MGKASYFLKGTVCLSISTPGFRIPVFCKGNDFYLQEVSKDGFISNFIPYHEKDITENVAVQEERIIGDLPVYAFLFNVEDVVFANRLEMNRILRERQPELSEYPFTNLEVYDFLDEFEKLPAAIIKAAETMLDDHPKGALSWAYFEGKTLCPEKVDVKELDVGLNKLAEKAINSIQSQIDTLSANAEYRFKRGHRKKALRHYSKAADLGRKALDCLNFTTYVPEESLALKTVTFAYRAGKYGFAKQIANKELRRNRVQHSVVSQLQELLNTIQTTENVIAYLNECAKNAGRWYGSSKISPPVDTISKDIGSTNEKVIKAIKAWISTISFAEFGKKLKEWEGTYETLSSLVDELESMRLWQVIAVISHPLVRLRVLVYFLDERDLDADATLYTVQYLLSIGDDPNIKEVSRRIHRYFRPFLVKFTCMIEEQADALAEDKTTSNRSTLYQTAEYILGHLPGGEHQTNPQLAIQDLAWRAVLRDKAGKDHQASELASYAISRRDEIENEKEPTNPYLWYRRIADATRLVAKASLDPYNMYWDEAKNNYQRALEPAEPKAKNGLKLRLIDMERDRIRLLFSHKSMGWQEEAVSSAEYAIQICHEIDTNDSSIPFSMRIKILEANLRDIIAQALARIDQERSKKEEAYVQQILKNILDQQPNSKGAIWFGWRFWDRRSNPEKAAEWLDLRVTQLRQEALQEGLSEKTKRSYRGFSDYIEFVTACYFLDHDFLFQARKRLKNIITETQPGNYEAYRLLGEIGLSAEFSEEEAQKYYREALKQARGTTERQNALRIALDRNKELVKNDPEQNDPIPWTRQARLIMFQGDNESALQILTQLVDKFPNDPFVQFHIGEVQYRRKNFNKAKISFAQAWNVEPRIETADRTAACYVKLENRTKATEWYNRGIELDQRDPWIVNGLGWLYYKWEDNPSALEKWIHSLRLYEQSLDKVDVMPEPRWESRARCTARAILRVGSTEKNVNWAEQGLGPRSLQQIAIAANSLVWDNEQMVEIVWSMIQIADEPHQITVSKFAQAVRAHFIYLFLVHGDESAWDWHNQWFDVFKKLGNQALICEYLGGAKGAYSRASMWAAGHLATGGQINVPKPQATLNPRWNDFVNIASSWGIVEGYYPSLHNAFPQSDNPEETYLVATTISSNLLYTSFQEVGLPTSNYDLPESNSSLLEKVLVAACNIREFSREVVSLKTILLPKNANIKTNIPQVLVDAELLSNQLLITAASRLVSNGTTPIKMRWFNEPKQDEYVSLGMRDGRVVSEEMVEKSFRPFAEHQLHNRISVNDNEFQIGFPLSEQNFPDKLSMIS